MTFRATFAILIEVALLIMVMGSDIREFLIAAVCLGGLLVLSFISVLFSALLLRFSVSCKDTACVRKENIGFTLKIRGLLLFPVVCSMTVATPFKEKYKSVFPIHSNIALSVFKIDRYFDFNVNCLHSGCWKIGVKRLRVCDLFGFFKLPVIFTPKKNYTVKIFVTPKFHEQARFIDAEGTLDSYSGFAFGNSETGEVFEDNRDYQYGDPLRRINWKQSAKYAKPITRLYDKPKKTRVIIAVDYYTLESKGSCDDIYREAALFIAEYFTEHKNDVMVSVLRPENLMLDFNCNDITDLSALALELADIYFKKDSFALTDIPLNDYEFYDRDRLFIITSNPHSSLIEAVKIMNSQGMYVAIITPKTSDIRKEFNSPYITVVTDCDEISQKVGAVSC